MTRSIYPDGAYEAKAGKPYRPSNGTEGDLFVNAWCTDCYRFDAEDGPLDCPVFEGMFCHEIGEEGYPEELVWADNGQPLCKAFIHHLDAEEKQETYRCDATPDLFQEGAQNA